MSLEPVWPLLFLVPITLVAVAVYAWAFYDIGTLGRASMELERRDFEQRHARPSSLNIQHVRTSNEGEL